MKGFRKSKKPMNQKTLTAILILFVLVISGFLICFSYLYSPVDVVIDAGHGGKDVGAEYNGRYEKDDNLNISLKVAQILKDNDIKVALTRDDDSFISLENRVKTANLRKAKLFVALHRNSAENAKGVEIWVSSNADEEEMFLASQIMNKLSDAGISLNRGVKKGYAQGNGDYYVNKHTRMSSCLVELGFINNKTDNELLDSNSDAYAQAISEAILEALKQN